jgi:hypothetical protein
MHAAIKESPETTDVRSGLKNSATIILLAIIPPTIILSITLCLNDQSSPGSGALRSPSLA